MVLVSFRVPLAKKDSRTTLPMPCLQTEHCEPGGRGMILDHSDEVTTLPSSQHLRESALQCVICGSKYARAAGGFGVRHTPKGGCRNADEQERTLLYLVNRVRKCEKKTFNNFTRRQ